MEIHGHRGCRGLMPENTLPAFIRAIDEGVDVLELDVVISQDHKVVVSHEPFFHPDFCITPSGKRVKESRKGNLYQINYRQIKKYDVGSAVHPKFPEQKKVPSYKPLLKDVIAECERYAKVKGLKPLRYNIEIKSLPELYETFQPGVEEFSDLVHYDIFSQLQAERVILQSFDFNVLQHWKKRIDRGLFSKASLSLLVEPFDDNEIEPVLGKLGFVPDVWSPYFLQLNQEKIASLHVKGIKVIPWTVNEPEAMKKMSDLKCDGLITDYPDRAIHLFK